MGQCPLSALKGPGRALWLRHPSVTLQGSQGHEDLGIITSVHQRRRSSRAPTKANTKTELGPAAASTRNSCMLRAPPLLVAPEITLTGCHTPWLPSPERQAVRTLIWGVRTPTAERGILGAARRRWYIALLPVHTLAYCHPQESSCACIRRGHNTHTGNTFRPAVRPRACKLAQVSEAVEETHLLSPSPMPGSLKEAPDARVPSAPEGPKGFFSPSVAIIAISSSKLDEGPSGHKEEESTAQVAPDPENAPIGALDEEVSGCVAEFHAVQVLHERASNKDRYVCHPSMQRPILWDLPESLRAPGDSLQPECEGSGSHQPLPRARHQVGPHVLWNTGKERVPKVGVLIFILGVIFVKAHRTTKEEIWEVLPLMGMLSGSPGSSQISWGKDTWSTDRWPAVILHNLNSSGNRAYAETTKIKVLEDFGVLELMGLSQALSHLCVSRLCKMRKGGPELHGCHSLRGYCRFSCKVWSFLCPWWHPRQIPHFVFPKASLC